MNRRSISCFNFLLLISGTALILSAVGSFFLSEYMVQNKIHENVVIKNGSDAYKFWLDPPATIYRKYYLFDVRNPLEVEKGEKPQLVQMGPYTYSEVWEKRHIEFLGPDVIRFTPVVTLHFEPSLSNGSESDTLTFLNIPAVGMIEQTVRSRFKELGPTLVNTLLAFLNTKLFVTKTAGELISGYNDPLMKLAKTFMPQVIKDEKFSLINGKNATEWQNYTMMTGNDYASNVAKIIAWNGLEKLNFWESESANLINGTDGTFYPPFLNRKTRLYSFNPDMCRSYYLTYLKDSVINGVHTYDFHLPKDAFYNSTLNPDNDGFCTNCLGNGVLNISNCYGGVSGFISQPHFLNADEKFVNAVKGLKPDNNLHDFVIHFEPTTSVPLGGNIRLQVSFYMPQNDKINLVKKVKPVLFPVVWFDETLALNSDTAAQLKKVAFYMKLVNIIPIVMATLGGFILALSAFYIFKEFSTKKAQKNLRLENAERMNESSRLVDKADQKVYS
ncbi:unnamed protein product [Brachionus calyciflorus]|uniref:Scavenger receptor class B member 1 n=1 Tax=Brachionus calyciflorus TaxID=104777 RepID=A0A814B0L7_9BILA|nr:unnamed protein product [Brachionus calyciflorus]